MNMGKTIYISLPIAGLDLQEQIAHAENIERTLEHFYDKVLNPFDNGVPIDAHPSEHMRADFKMLLEKNGLPPIRFHELRHSCASMLLNEGFSLKDIQAYMGHADITMTADLYGHLDVARKEMLSRNLANSIFQ